MSGEKKTSAACSDCVDDDFRIDDLLSAPLIKTSGKKKERKGSEKSKKNNLSRCHSLPAQPKKADKSDSSSEDRSSKNHQTNNNPARYSHTSRINSLSYSMCADDAKFQKRVAHKLLKQQVPRREETKIKMPLFSHLIQMERDINISKKISFGRRCPIHPSFITLGVQSAEGTLYCTRERSLRLLSSLQAFIKDYNIPSGKDVVRDFELRLSPSLSFLSQCRRNSSGMATIIKLFKQKFSESIHLSKDEIKSSLVEYLDTFRYERITFAGDVICTYLSDKINNNDVILTSTLTPLIFKAMLKALKSGKIFKIIVVDTPPRFEARKFLKHISENGIKCVYIGLNALSMVMHNVTKILVQADSLLSNGAALSPIGSALITNIGSYFRVPVLVCCETYNFSERAQSDAYVYNELGDPDDILKLSYKGVEKIDNWKENPKITLLNLYHDVIQPQQVAAVVTELGIIPATSAPVILRVKN